MAKSDKTNESFTTLGLGSTSDEPKDKPSGDEAAGSDSFTTLGLGSIAGRGRNRNPAPDEGTRTPAPGPSRDTTPQPPANNRLEELRRRRDAQIQEYLRETEAAVAANDFGKARAAIEQAALFSPDDPRVMVLLDAVDRAEKAMQEVMQAARHIESEPPVAEPPPAASPEPTPPPVAPPPPPATPAPPPTAAAPPPVTSTPPPVAPAAPVETSISPATAVEGHAGSPGILSGVEDSTGARRGFSIADIPLAAKVGAGVAAVVIVGVMLVFSLSGSDGEPPAVSQAEAPAAAAAALPPAIDPAAAAMPDPETDGDQPPGAASATAPPAAQTPAAAAAGNQPARTAAPPRQAAPAPPPRPAAPAPRVQRPAPTPPPRPAPEPTGPFRIGSDLERPTRTTNVAPIYPQAAQDAGIEGVVILETVISATGQVTDVNVLRSVDATVDEAAVAAARQWVYSPTLRNGVAVPVILTETVNFVLDNARAGAGDVRTAPPDRPASPSPTAPAGPIPVGGNVERPTRINDVAPLYPQVAQEAGIEGMVILQTEIAANGRVNNVTVLRSVDPILDEAAIAAARQWTYSPTLQNGVAVSVLMTETVNFVLPDAPPPVPAAAGSIENTDPRALLGLTMGQVRNQVGIPQRGNDTTWTYDTSSGVVTLTFTDTADDGDFPNLIVTRVQSPQGTVRRMPR